MILPPNGYRSALLIIAIVGFIAGGIAFLVGSAAGDDLGTAVAAFGVAWQFAGAGFIAFVLFLTVSAILWGLHSEGTGLVKGSEPPAED